MNIVMTRVPILAESMDCAMKCSVGIMRITKILPFRFLYRLSDASGALLYCMAWKRTKRIKSNLAKCFPEKTDKELSKLTRQFFTNMNDFAYEIAKSAYFSDEEFLSRCHIVNKDFIADILKENKKVLCYSGHFINYEWLVSFPLHMPGVLMGHLYHSGRTNPLMEWLKKSRQKFGAVNIPHNYPMKPILSLFKELDEKKSDGVIIGTLADIAPSKNILKTVHQSPFFGHTLSVYSGSERIGRYLNMTFVYAHINRTERGYYSIEFKKLEPNDIDTNPCAYTDEFVRCLEQNIREQPDLWMLWADRKMDIA